MGRVDVYSYEMALADRLPCIGGASDHGIIKACICTDTSIKIQIKALCHEGELHTHGLISCPVMKEVYPCLHYPSSSLQATYMVCNFICI